MNRCSINHYGNANQNQMRYHFTTVRMPKIKTNNKCNEDVEKMKPSRKASGKVKRCIAALEISLAALQNTQHRNTMWYGNSTPRYRHKRNENTCP